jgi:hypothetical protein
MAVKNIVLPIVMTNINSTTVIATYLPINPTGLPHACFMIRIINASNAAITISYDGTNDHDFLAANTSTPELEFQTNSQPNNLIAKLAQGTIVYVKGTAGVGNVYLTGWYQPNLN